MAAGEKIKERFEEFKERQRARLEKSKRVGKTLVGAAIGGAVHGGIRAKTRGKVITGNITYDQVATAGVTVLALRDEKMIGPAAGMIGATSSRAVEDAILRADQNQAQPQVPRNAQLPGAPAAQLPAAQRVPGVPNVINMPAPVRR